jgi:hypothetical protein
MKPRRVPQAGNGKPNQREHQLRMTHHSGLLDLRRFAAVAFALLLAFTLTAAIAAPGADAKKKTKVSLKITTKNQAKLLKDNKLTVKVKSNGKAKVKVQASSGGKNNYFKKKTVKFKKKGTKKVKLKLTSKGSSKLSLCGAKTVKATGKYGKKKAKKKKKLAKDSSRCIKVPLGSDPQNCDFLDTTVCLQPFANDYYTVNDNSTPTGKRLNLADDSTPANIDDVHMDPTDINRSDGFSPGNMVVLKVPGLDTPAAFNNSKLVPISNLQAYENPNQAVMIIDAKTGERHPIWAEIDANPTSVDPSVDGPGGIAENPQNTGPVNLIVRPAENFQNGHRYIVAFRHLKNANGKTIQSPAAFRTYRDKIITTQNVVEKRRDHMNSVINKLVNKAGVKRSSLYMAWDFTVSSQEGTTSRALTIRDDAFERLGDSNLANRTIEGSAPSYSIQSATDPGGTTLIRVEGTLEDVPCYISSPDCAPGGVFEFDGNGDLTWNPLSTTDVPFRCNVPQSVRDLNAGSVTPTQTGTYGHGLLGSLGQVNGQDRIGLDANTTWCAVDWAGFSDGDTGVLLETLADVSNFPKLADRMQQGFVNFLYLQRLLIHPNGLSQAPELQYDNGSGPESVIDTSQGVNTRGQYMGISQGGIMGGALTALSPDADYGVLGVPGMNYSALLRRSVDSDDYFKNPVIGLYKYYPNESDRALLLSLIQIMWDRGEANGYSHNITGNPLPNTPPHEVLLRLAFGDHQVANVTAETVARTIGAKVYYPALQPGRHWEQDPFMDLEKVSTFPWQDGSLMAYYDGGPTTFDGRKRQGDATPPNENLPPREEWDFGKDPHSLPRDAKSGVRHAVTFLNGPGLALGSTRGTIESCAITGAGDYFSSGMTPIPPPAVGDERCYSNGWNGIDGLTP